MIFGEEKIIKGVTVRLIPCTSRDECLGCLFCDPNNRCLLDTVLFDCHAECGGSDDGIFGFVSAEPALNIRVESLAASQQAMKLAYEAHQKRIWAFQKKFEAYIKPVIEEDFNGG